MFNAKSFGYMKQLEEAELENAVKTFGAVFNSKHEAYAVLLEEIDECSDELNAMQEHLQTVWKLIKADDNDSFDSIIQKIILLSLASESLILEGSQVHAVCEKFITSLKGEMKDEQ